MYDSRVLVNITIECFTLALVLVLIVSMAREAVIRRRQMLLTCMVLHVLAVICELACWLCDGAPGLAARVVLELGSTGVLLFRLLTGVAIMLYVCTDASSESLSSLRSNRTVMFLLGLNAFCAALVLTNSLTHVFFSVNDANIVRFTSALDFFDVVMLAQSVGMYSVVAQLRKKHGRATVMRLLTCGTLTTVALLLGLVLDKKSLLSPAVALVLVLLSVGVQVRLEEDLADARVEAAESRMRLLSGQIHPHFIFNSLNAIKALVVEDPELAERTIQDFSDYLRSHLDEMSSSRLVPFVEEMNHVRHYVSLEMADPVRPMEVVYDLPVEDFLVPPLTVQPLVENAIRHGIRTREEGGTVYVRTSENETSVMVSVTDDGHGFSSATELQDHRRRVGIENVRERIERQCQGTLEVHSGSNGTTAVMVLPKGDA